MYLQNLLKHTYPGILLNQLRIKFYLNVDLQELTI